MNIKSRIPEKFYKLFNSKYREYYQVILINLYEESGQSYSLLGLTEEECREIIDEINNTDSQKYAILTTTDSFYRYKEEVKELINKNLIENQERKQLFVEKRLDLELESLAWRKNEKGIKVCEEAMEILIKINREFDGIEKRYNKLIDQKRIFAKRAIARIRYILVEGNAQEDRTKILIKLLDNSQRKDEIIEELGRRLKLTEKAHAIKEKSFLRPRDMTKREFAPQKIENLVPTSSSIEDFVIKPLYTRAEIRKFRHENEVDGVFKVSKDTVKTVQDLEKLLFVWQEATEISEKNMEIEIGEEFATSDGLKYSGFSIGRK